mmetsp:Transcript_2908/g.8752  ORF Transcript_2908/g.8752 Transcript_2908/m.8752 type:complete len:704 (-) Transcript_2908:116-2227(-)
MARMALPAAAPDVRAPARPKICQTYWPMADDAEDDLTPLKGVDAVVTWTTAAAHALSEEAEARIGAHRARQKGVWSAGLPNPNRKEREKIFEKVHMEANFLPASFLRRGAERARAVCRVETGTSYGSGVLLTPNIIMTNNHVLENARMASSSKARFNLENDPAEDDEPFTVDLLPDRLFITDVDLDFSIVACETVNDITPVRLLRNPATVATGERVNIIQHPQGRKKEVVLHENTVIGLFDTMVHYRADTEPGSSGSPVFNDEWELVALHHAGWKDRRWGSSAATNEGVRIAAIVAHLLHGREAASASGDEEMTRELETALSLKDNVSPYLGFFDTDMIDRERDSHHAEVSMPDFTGSDRFADVGIWNIEHFTSRRISSQRVRTVGNVVANLGLDVLGLCEVGQVPMDKLVADLNSRGLAFAHKLYDVTGGQDLSVLYDTETTTVELREDLNTRFIDRFQKRVSGKLAFPREPLFAECTVTNAENGGKISFMLIVVHLKAMGGDINRARRRLAAEELHGIMDELKADDFKNRPIIIGGDFNEKLSTPGVLDPLVDQPDIVALTTADSDAGSITYLGNPRYHSLIDHIVVSSDTIDRVAAIDDDAGDAGRVGIVRLDRSVDDFVDKVSDHAPVVFRMIFDEERPGGRRNPTDPLNPFDPFGGPFAPSGGGVGGGGPSVGGPAASTPAPIVVPSGATSVTLKFDK